MNQVCTNFKTPEGEVAIKVHAQRQGWQEKISPKGQEIDNDQTPQEFLGEQLEEQIKASYIADKGAEDSRKALEASNKKYADIKL